MGSKKLLARTVVAAAIGVLAPCSTPAYAQIQADRPLRLVVPLAPGGTNDTIARIISDKFAERIKQNVVVDNRPGGNAIIGTQIVARAPANGNTLLMIGAGHSINASLMKSLPYDSVRDFAPVGSVAGGPYLMVVPVSIPAKTAKEFVGWAKANAGKVSYASAGAGNPTHLAGELFKMAAGIDMLHVPYKGGGAVLPDLLAGRVATFFASVSTALIHVNSGKLRPIAVTTKQRSPQVPDTPTFMEAGYADVEVNAWYGMLTTAGTPKARLDQLSRALQQVLSEQQTRDLITKQGLVPEPSSSDEFSRLIRSDIVKWAKVVKAAGIQPE